MSYFIGSNFSHSPIMFSVNRLTSAGRPSMVSPRVSIQVGGLSDGLVDASQLPYDDAIHKTEDG